MPCGSAFSRCCRPHPDATSASPAASRSPTARSSPASCSCSRPASPGTTCPPSWAAAAARPAATPCGSGTQAGVWRELHALLLAELNGADQIDWGRALIDASFAKAPEGGQDTGPNPTDRGKSGSKHHVMTDAQGVPLAATVTAANVNEVTQVFQVLTDMPPVGGKPGPKRQKPERLQGDRGYDSEPVRQVLRWLGITPVLAARNTEHGSGLGVVRWFVERTISWLHSFGRLRPRLDRLTEIQEAFLRLACALICLRLLDP
jgi:transposase